jgi:hypothetical protein
MHSASLRTAYQKNCIFLRVLATFKQQPGEPGRQSLGSARKEEKCVHAAKAVYSSLRTERMHKTLPAGKRERRHVSTTCAL